MNSQITFFVQLMKRLNINVSILEENEMKNDIDLNFRSSFFTNYESSPLYELIKSKIKNKTVYFVTDPFYCKYICLLFTSDESDCSYKKLIIGPYCDIQITQNTLLEIMEFNHITSSLEFTLKKYYDLIPLITNESYLNAMIYTFADQLWGNANNYKIESVNLNEKLNHELAYVAESPSITPVDSKIDMELIEKNYKTENEMIQIVSQGQIHKLNQFIKDAPPLLIPMESRNPDPLRNAKNYLIISNSIFRKAAETGGVHPFYINEVSRNFALQIESLNSVQDINNFAFSIMKKYCLLVHNNSTRQYSPLIQQLIVMIDSDLSGDLSLNTLASSLNVNASYLSALFKKDLGITLTAYVTKKRVDYAIFLLNTSVLQIQSIATHCGIPDLNYFTKTFKKIVGITPSQYRQEIHKHS